MRVYLTRDFLTEGRIRIAEGKQRTGREDEIQVNCYPPEKRVFKLHGLDWHLSMRDARTRVTEIIKQEQKSINRERQRLDEREKRLNDLRAKYGDAQEHVIIQGLASQMPDWIFPLEPKFRSRRSLALSDRNVTAIHSTLPDCSFSFTIGEPGFTYYREGMTYNGSHLGYNELPIKVTYIHNFVCANYLELKLAYAITDVGETVGMTRLMNFNPPGVSIRPPSCRDQVSVYLIDGKAYVGPHIWMTHSHTAVHKIELADPNCERLVGQAVEHWIRELTRELT